MDGLREKGQVIREKAWKGHDWRISFVDFGWVRKTKESG